jgi:antitoxin (DNA-binding transcriptional repressor) of toxin-antitoxin stability system
MQSINMLQAKTSLSRLVDRIERGLDKEIIIARNGRPAARLVPIQNTVDASQRIGLLKGKFKAPSLETLDKHNEKVASLFLGKR